MNRHAVNCKPLPSRFQKIFLPDFYLLLWFFHLLTEIYTDWLSTLLFLVSPSFQRIRDIYVVTNGASKHKSNLRDQHTLYCHNMGDHTIPSHLEFHCRVERFAEWLSRHFSPEEIQLPPLHVQAYCESCQMNAKMGLLLRSPKPSEELAVRMSILFFLHR